ncbi:hypothetical protein D9611_003773 [Ephemerocybe angulata]|uniref:Cytochrome b561 domain-containing protein n=1 Tax=Ephemerocybe angulata TaxID=980116 RepID=A0A8H5B5E1_9AGAR|nr:hypothetical protein D9611_003773 [Tulosesus angulatus]
MKAFTGLAVALTLARCALAVSFAARAEPAAPSPTLGYGTVSNGSATAGSSTTSGSATGQKGDSKCVATMCVEALVQGDNVQYTLTSQRTSVGWMAMGFGSSMVNTPMVIMWANQDGTVTLSQRQARDEVEPSVVASPPRTASALQSASVTTGSNPKFVYTIPANSDTKQTIIYAFGDTNPGSTASNARLLEHIAQGTMTLDLTKVDTSGTGTGTGTGTGGGAGGSSSLGPLTDTQKMIVAHGIIATLGFVLFLPIGALVPRYLRTFVGGRTWFKLHWILQFLLGGITIVIGVALGFAAVSNRSGNHASTTHKRVGIVLFVLYFAQIGLGAVIHWVKPRAPRARPPQNYIHAILGILIIALALFQVRTGYRTEWPSITGRDDVPNGVNIVWYIWVVVLPVAYFAGMVFLKKQYAQERKTRESTAY